MIEYKITCPICGETAWIKNGDSMLCENDNCRAVIVIDIGEQNDDGFATGQIQCYGIYRFKTRETKKGAELCLKQWK